MFPYFFFRLLITCSASASRRPRRPPMALPPRVFHLLAGRCRRDWQSLANGHLAVIRPADEMKFIEHIVDFANSRLRSVQDLKPLLRKMLVMCQHFRDSQQTHGLHRKAVRHAVLLCPSGDPRGAVGRPRAVPAD
jgi:hypothetical protein